MAKKAVAAVESDNFTDRILGEVEKEYGQGIMISGDDYIAAPRVVLPFSPSLDCITGGIEEGSCLTITGPPKHGKTSLAFWLAARAQQEAYGSRPVYYAKTEGRLAVKLIRGTSSLVTSSPQFNIIHSQEGRILSAQDFLTILEKIIKTVPGAFIIIDSISALCEEKEQAEGIGTETRGGGAKLYAQFCRIINQVVPVNRSIVVGITHRYANTSGQGAKWIEKASGMWGYQIDYHLAVKMKTAWKVGEKPIGMELLVQCNASKTSTPGLSINTFIRYGLGVDELHESIVLGNSTGLVRQRGAWFQLEFLRKHPGLLQGEPPSFQGAEKTREAFVQNPEWAAALRRELSEMSLGTSGGGEE